MLAVDDDEQVMCLRQYRHTSGHEFVELPAGLRDAGDEPAVETAKRELREEVELDAADWRLLLSTFPSAGITDEVHEIFLARGLTHAPRGDFEMEHEEAEMEPSGCPWPTCSRPSSRGGCARGRWRRRCWRTTCSSAAGPLTPRSGRPGVVSPSL